MDKNRYFKRTVLALAVSMAFPVSSALAQEDVAELISPNETEAGVKLQYLNDVNPLYRQYYGLNNDGVNGSADLKLIRRSDEGRWIRLEGRDLGLRTQEFNASVEQQGDWKLGIDYNQIPRFAPFVVRTRVTGIGHDTLNVGNVFDDKDLKTERTATSLTATKFISRNLQANVIFKNEDKKGERLFGANGNIDPGGYLGQLFTPEPINSNHKQIEASLDYSTEKFYVSGGYYGSFFENKAGKGLFVNFGTRDGLVPIQGTPTQMSPLSLAPDNQAHQFSLAGGYNWSRDTRANFKVSKSFAKQDDGFIPESPFIPYLPTMKRSDLGGKVDTTNAFASLTSRVTDKLNLLASWAYEDRDDRTPQLDYAIYRTTILQNNPESQSSHRGKFEASYRLPQGFNVTAGYDYDFRKYDGMDELYRDEVKENTYRIDVRKSLGDTVNGALTFAHSKRDGSRWGTSPATFTGPNNHPATGEHWTAPTQFSDRERDKVKLLVDWAPVDPLSVQFAYEYGLDDYKTRIFDIGLNEGRSELFSLDASYRFNDRWKANMWASHSSNDIKQNSLNSTYGSLCDGSGRTTAERIKNTCVPWGAKLKLSSNAVGAGFDGQINSKLSVGGQYLYSRDVNEYDISFADAGTFSSIRKGAGILPDTEYTLNTLRLFARYAITKATAIRLDYVWDRRELDDFTWSNWTYSDGTRVLVNPDQITRIIAVSVSHAF